MRQFSVNQGVDISVVILTHNRAEMIGRALRSIFSSHITHFSHEVIVLDDGSTDETEEVLHQFRHKISILRNQVNLGVGQSSQIALEASTGEFFVRVDSDDFISSDFLQTLLMPIKHRQEIGLVTCDHLLVNDKEQPQGVETLEDKEEYMNYGAGMVFRKSEIVKVGGYDTTLRFGEDLDLHMRLSNSGVVRFHYPVPLYRRRIHAANMSSSSLDAIQRVEIKERYGEI